MVYTMKKCVLFAMPLVFCAQAAHAWPGTVLSIQDGDTLTVAPAGDATCPLPIRLYGIDAPESGQAHGPEATAYLAGLLPVGSAVEVMPLDRDKYGRSVALVARGGKVVNGQMVAAGHAWVYAKYCLATMCKGWYANQKKAAASGMGLWAVGENVVAPWVWRKKKEN